MWFHAHCCISARSIWQACVVNYFRRGLDDVVRTRLQQMQQNETVKEPTMNMTETEKACYNRGKTGTEKSLPTCYTSTFATAWKLGFYDRLIGQGNTLSGDQNAWREIYLSKFASEAV